MAPRGVVLALCLIFIVSSASVYSDPDPLKDFCVPENTLNESCKDPNQVTPDDFTSEIFRQPFDTSNVLRVNVTLVGVSTFPGLHTQGLSIARLAFGPFGVNPPHLHQRASEVLYMLQGSLYVGFVASNPANKLFDKVLQPGDLFIFPRGLVHFQRNLGNVPALALSSLGSENPGRTDAALALFGTTPPIMNEVLESAFQVSENVVENLRFRVSKTLQSPVIPLSLRSAE